MEYKNIPISKIFLDKNNPRIAKYLMMYGDNPTVQQMYLALGVTEPGSISEGGTTFHSLRESIKTNGGLIHPIIVNKTSTNKYLAIEGNTRLAIYHEFYENKVAGEWATIPCIVHNNISKQEIDAIRLQAHLVGPRDWDPYSKAKYLYELRNSSHLPWAQVIDFCGGKSKEAELYVAAYKDMEKYYRGIIEDEGSFDATRFSAFVELQKPRIKESIINAGFQYEDFAKWVDKRLIDRIENVRRLPEILSKDDIKRVFLQKGSKEAIKVLDAPTLSQDNLISLSIVELAKVIIGKIRKIGWEEIKTYKEEPSAPEPQTLLDLKDELNEFFNLINKEKE